MKTSAFKFTKLWINKIDFYSSKKYLSKKTILIGVGAFFLLAVFVYLFRPVYFDYNAKREIIQNKINNVFKLNTKIKGKISYRILPSPKIIIKNARLDFGKNKKDQLNIKEIHILISPFKINNIESLEFKKILILNQKIKVFSNNLNNIFKRFQSEKKEILVIKKSTIIFVDDQKSEVIFNNFNLTEKFINNKHQINGSVNFSDNKINIKFLNKVGEEKYLKINIPKLKQSLDINFNPESTLNNLSGKLKLKLFESILLLNFKGKDNFEISKSYLRNKFINSKIDGKINLKDQFAFDLNLDINQINLKKLLIYYPFFNKGGISKKINGKLDILIKNSDSFFGRIRNIKMKLEFENGDIRISNAQGILPEKSKFKSNLLILMSGNRPKIEFNTNFNSDNAPKFLRKFGINDFSAKNTSLYVDGAIDLEKNKIKFNKIIKNNNERINKGEVLSLESSFNENILKDGVLGLLDYFKFKKFLKENL